MHPVPIPNTPPDRAGGWNTIRTLLPYLWEFKGRVILALLFLVTAKVANVGVPLVMKEVVDALDAKTAVIVLPLTLLVLYGALRASNTMFAELRDIVFVRVTRRAIRRVALQVFRHLHALSLRFHLERQTGGVSRDIDRGTRGISTLLSYLLFSIIPVILEFGLVAAVLLSKFDWLFAAITFATWACTYRVSCGHAAKCSSSPATNVSNGSACGSGLMKTQPPHVPTFASGR